MRTVWTSVLVGCAFLSTACGDSNGVFGGGGSGPGTGGDNTTTGGNSSDGGGPMVACGNGVLDAGEACDGTNLAGQDCGSQGFASGTLLCSPSCTFDTSGCGETASCGDSLVGGTEDCDGTNLDGETCMTLGFDSGTLACSADCTFDTAGCTTTVGCGNGNIDAGEDCDGNLLNGATCVSQGFDGGTLGCDGDCTFDTSQCSTNPACGDGVVDAGEECDDGNTTAGDGCSSTCTLEGPPGSWTCDATFYNTQDGCDCSCGAHDPDCDIQPPEGLYCEGNQASQGTTCVNDVCVPPAPVCGNSVVETGEQCDDGNTTNGDGCSSTCQGEGIPPGWTCNINYYDAQDGCDCSCGAHDPDCDIQPPEGLFCGGVFAQPGTVCTNDVCVAPVCGNGVVEGNEDCDDGNTTSGDGCSSTCQLEAPPTWTCDPTFYSAQDGCDCSCGAHDPDCDIVPPEGLFCGGGNAPPGTVCTNDVCITPPPVCGDGIIEAGEQCDDGNTTSGDGCSSTCQDEPPPPTWTCNPNFYAAHDGCDCSCGAHDPDCDIVPPEGLFCGGAAAPPGTVCTNDVCVP